MGCWGFGFDILRAEMPPSLFLTSLDATSSSLDCSAETHPFGFVAASGTIIDLVVGVFMLAIFKIYRLRVSHTDWNTTYYFLWLYTIFSLCHGSGYLMFSPPFWFGDWSFALDGLGKDLQLALRVLLCLFGVIIYVPTLIWGFRTLQPLLGRENPYRYQRAIWLLVIPYIFSMVVPGILAGLIISPSHMLLNAGANGGSEFYLVIFCLLTYVLRYKEVPSWVHDPPVTVNYSSVWIVLGVLSLISTIVLSFGVPFSVSPYWAGALA